MSDHSEFEPERPISQGLPATVNTDEFLQPRPGFLVAAAKGLCWLYLACIVAVWLLLRSQIDQWWPATLLGYSPRYLLAAPLLILLPICLWKFRKGMLLLSAAGLLIGWPIMGLQIPLQTSTDIGGANGLRILSANMGGGCSTEALLELIDRETPDLVVLQEYSRRRNHQVFEDRGWHIQSHGGLFCASRSPIVSAETVQLNPEASWEVRVARFEIAGPEGAFQLFDIHLPTVRDGLQEVIDDKFDGIPELERNSESRMRESQAVSQWVRSFSGSKIMLGDFNMPQDSAIYREGWSQFENAFSARGLGYGFTKFTRYHGIRIDHVLYDRTWEAVSCRVGPDLGGDHRPVISELSHR